MPRIRTLKPEHRQHRKIGALSHLTYRLWVGMILDADDEGRLVADADQLRVTIFSYFANVRRALVEASLAELDRLHLIRLYQDDGVRYAWFPSWHDHQKIDRPRPSKLPPYNDSARAREDSSRIRRGLDTDLIRSDLIGREGKGSDLIGGEPEGNHDPAPADTARPSPAQSGVTFQIPSSIRQALDKAPRLGAASRLRDAGYWQAVIRAHPGVDYARELLRAEVWLTANSARAKKDLPRFLANWIGRAERPDEEPT